jgi:Arc/MetJ-type ribon-helix-helix transcriptional regulator
MTITLPLQPQEEARLIAVARARGITADEVVREALRTILSESADLVEAVREPTRSARGMLAKYGAAPSAAEIDENRSEMFASFARDDF